MPSSERTSSARQAPRGRAGAGQSPRPLADAAKLAKPPAAQLGPYLYRVPMSSGVWAISTDESPGAVLPRGLYQQERDPEADSPRYAVRAALPYVHARVIRRDGSGRQSTVDYLISADRESPRAIVTHHQVRTGEWAGAVSIPLSDDSKIVAAAGTAIRHMRPLGDDYAGEREAVPRIGPDGKVTVPVAEVLPDGYLTTGPLGQTEALALWRDRIAPVATANPRLALAIGAAMVGPWIGALGPGLCHIVDLYGDPAQGKTTALYVAGGLWGNSLVRGGVVRSWNATKISIGRLLGSLGILPAYLDERGLAGFGPAEWGQMTYSITDGPRQASDRSSSGFHLTSPWEGVLISAGNGRMLDGLGAGKYAGVVRRVVCLSTPFTRDADEAESVIPALRDAYGYPGRVALDRFTSAEVDRLIRSVVPLVGMPTAPVARTIAKCLHADVAGAAMLDQVLGTGTAIRDAAARAAREHLEANGQDPEHDADRMLTLIRDCMASQPARWPTVAEYREHKRPRPVYGQDGTPAEPDRVDLPQHQVDRNVAGVRADDGSWFAVVPSTLDELLARAGADRSVALTEADRRGWLHRTVSDRAAGKMGTKVKGIPGRPYRFNLPADDDHQDQDVAPEPGSAPAPDTSAPGGCVLCGEPTTNLIDGEPWHPWCAEPEPDSGPGPGPEPDSGPEPETESAPAVALCPACNLTLPDGEGLTIGGYHLCCAPEDAPEPAPEPAPVAPAEVAPADDHGQAPEPAQEHSERAEVTDAEELAHFTKEVRKVDADATDEDIAAGLNIWHEITGVRWVSYAGQVGQAWFSMLAARHASIRRPEALTSPILREITATAPLTRVNFVAKPKTAIKPGKHFVTSYDANGQFPAAAGSADLGDGEPITVDNPRSIAGLVNLPGYVKTAAQVRTGHPGFGVIPAGRWIAMPLVKFLASDLGVTVPAAQAVYWPKHGRRLSAYIGRYRQARERLTSAKQTGPVRVALIALKSQANVFISMFNSETYSHGGFYRPDWNHMVVATAEANALRQFYGPRAKCKVAPVAKMADAVYFVADKSPLVPDGLEVSGQLGKWKPDRHGPVTDDLVKAVREGQPASVRDAVIRIDAERRSAE